MSITINRATSIIDQALSDANFAKTEPEARKALDVLQGSVVRDARAYTKNKNLNAVVNQVDGAVKALEARFGLGGSKLKTAAKVTGAVVGIGGLTSFGAWAWTTGLAGKVTAAASAVWNGGVYAAKTAAAPFTTLSPEAFGGVAKVTTAASAVWKSAVDFGGNYIPGGVATAVADYGLLVSSVALALVSIYGVSKLYNYFSSAQSAQLVETTPTQPVEQPAGLADPYKAVVVELRQRLEPTS